MPILGGCLCFDLPTGTKIIGALYLFCAIINTLGLTVLNIFLWVFDVAHKLIEYLEQVLQDMERDHQREHDPNVPVSYDDQIEEENTKEFRELLETIKENLPIARIVLLVLLVLSILSIITSSMLIHGVRKRCRGLLLPWVVQEIVHIIVIIAICVLVFMAFGTAQIAWTLALPMVVGIFLEIFFILVVISQFQALELIRMQDEMCMK